MVENKKQDSEFEDITSILEGEDFEGVEIVEAAAEDPAEPFWRIDKSVLAPLVKVMKEISQRNADQVSKTVLFEYNNGKLVVSATNKDISFSGIVPLKNEQNIMEGSVILLLKQIDDILKFSTEFLVYRKEGRPMGVLLKGEQPLDEFKFNLTMYRKGDELGEPGECDHVVILKEVSLFNSLMSLANVVEDKRMIIKDGLAYGMFISTLVRVATVLPNLVIKSTDIRDLLGLLMVYKEPVRIGVNKEKFIVRGESFQYSSLKVVSEIAKSEIAKFEAGQDVEGSIVDASHAFNIFSYLTVTNSDTAVAKITNEDGALYVNCKNRQGTETRFLLTGDSSLPGFDAQISVSKNVYRIMKGYTSLEMKVIEGFVMYRTSELEILQGVRKK